jgi:hypothetical protein
MHRTKYFGSNEKKEDSHFSATNESIIIPIIIILYRFSWKDERNIKVGNNDIERHHIDSSRKRGGRRRWWLNPLLNPLIAGWNSITAIDTKHGMASMLS